VRVRGVEPRDGIADRSRQGLPLPHPAANGKRRVSGERLPRDAATRHSAGMKPVLKRLADLDPSRRDALGRFVCQRLPGRWATPEAALAELGGVAFEDGRTALSVWVGDEPWGSLGVVVREIPVRAEAFVTAVAVPEGAEWAFGALVAEAMAQVGGEAPVRVALGLRPEAHLDAWARAHGFALHEESLRLVLRGEDPAVPADPAWGFAALDATMAETFREVANASFRGSPNGATLSAEEVEALMAEAPHPDAVGCHLRDGVAIGFHVLSLATDDASGERVGRVETLGLLPKVQGRGLGRALLARSVATLRRLGATAIVLDVMSSNVAAVRLYLGAGFVREAVLSRWYARYTSPSMTSL